MPQFSKKMNKKKKKRRKKIEMKRKRECNDPNSSGISAVVMTNELKEVLPRLFLSLEEKGINQKTYLECLSSSGIEVPQPTFSHWVSLTREGRSVISHDKATGREKILDYDEQRIFVGWACDCNDEGISVNLNSAREFIEQYFGTTLSDASIYRYLQSNGFASHKMKTRPAGYIVSRKTLVNDTFEWLKTISVDIPRDRVCSIDFTFTRHNTRDEHSYSPVGAPQPQNKKKITRYTNCIITCVFADGKNRTPALLFTYNPKFKRWDNWTKLRGEEESKLDFALDLNGISKDRVFYYDIPLTNSKTYFPECLVVLEVFWRKYPILKDCVIFTDEAKWLSSKGEDPIMRLGCRKHYYYKAHLHHFTSTNDNGLHAPAKQIWANSNIDAEDDVLRSLYLLKQLDTYAYTGKKAFDNNLQLWRKEGTEPDLEKIEKIIPTKGSENSPFYDECRREFRIFMGRDARGRVPKSPKRLDSSLDGKAWEIN